MSVSAEAERVSVGIEQTNNRELIHRHRLTLKRLAAEVNVLLSDGTTRRLGSAIHAQAKQIAQRIADISVLALAAYQQADRAVEKTQLLFFVRQALLEMHGKEKTMEIMRDAAERMRAHRENCVQRPQMAAGNAITLGSSGGMRVRR